MGVQRGKEGHTTLQEARHGARQRGESTLDYKRQILIMKWRMAAPSLRAGPGTGVNMTNKPYYKPGKLLTVLHNRWF